MQKINLLIVYPSQQKIVMMLATFLFLNITSAQIPNSWTQKNDLPGLGRGTAVGFGIGNYGYVCTGINFSAFVPQLSDCWRYDPSNNSWLNIASYGGGNRGAAAGFAINGKGYLMTGNGIGSVAQNDIWEYDPGANTWTQKANLTASTRDYAVAFSIGNCGYIATGRTGGSTNLSDLWKFNPSSNTWTQKTNFPGTARSSATGFGIGGKGYLGTGYDAGPTKNFWAYDTLSNAWTQIADAGLTPRSDATSFVINGHGFICAGAVAAGASTDLLEYDPVANSWTTRASLTIGKTNAAGFAIGSRGYLATGYDNAFNQTTDLWEYTPDSSLTTSVHEIYNDLKIIVAPNPLTDGGTIVFSSVKYFENPEVEIFSSSGKKISSSHFRKESSDKNKIVFRFMRNDLFGGVYFYSFKNREEKIVSGKIVIE